MNILLLCFKSIDLPHPYFSAKSRTLSTVVSPAKMLFLIIYKLVNHFCEYIEL